jgi:hypothetical protein
VVGLVDEEEVYRMFGGYLPVESAQPKISSLKHRGNSVHKEKKMHILTVMFKRYRQIPKKTEIRGQV